MARGLCGSRAFKIGRGSLGSTKFDRLLYSKIISDGVHLEKFIKKAKHHERLESGQGRGGIWVD
jgi:hypothetical protein